MKTTRQIYLDSGAVLTIGEDIFICTDPSGENIHLTAGQQKLLKKLAEHVNKPLSYDLLYAAYANDDQLLTYTGGANSNIAKMKRTFPDCIRTAIKNTRNIGYRLEGTTANTKKQPVTTAAGSHIAELSGDYYGFYLDPLGSGAMLGAYLHIENSGTFSSPSMNAYIILNVRSNQVLLSDTMKNIFTSENHNYKDAFFKFKDTLSDNDKRCSWGEGTISSEGNLAMIELFIHPNHGKWEILIDLENYLKGSRKKESEKDYYRGGLCIALATRTVYGTYCLRFGLIRKNFIKKSIVTDQEKILEMLKLPDGSRQAEWKPLKLSGWLDKCWYNWIMNE